MKKGHTLRSKLQWFLAVSAIFGSASDGTKVALYLFSGTPSVPLATEIPHARRGLTGTPVCYSKVLPF